MRSVGIRFKSAAQINQEELLTVPVSKMYNSTDLRKEYMGKAVEKL